MEMIQVGWLSILPPLIAIVLALITKEVISSLMIGILSGTLIYSIAAGAGGVLGVAVKTVENTFSLMATKMADNVNILLFLCLLGALVVVVTRAGGSRAYGAWAAGKLKGKRSAMLATALLGVLIFIDDYFNCLTVGTVMKPVTDKYKISRAKLAYIIDSTAAPICIIAPISSWAAAVGSNLQEAGGFSSTMSAFISTIPYNLYALLSILLVVILCVFKLDFGEMAKLERIAEETGDLGAIDTASVDETEISSKGKVYDLLIPVIGLIVFSVLAMLYTGGFFNGGVSIADAFGNCDSAASLVLGGFGGLIVAFFCFVPRGVVKFRAFMDGITEGIKSMVPACIILTLAWTISGVCRDLLGTGEYVGSLVEQSNISFGFIPAIVFVVAALLSFSTGTAWGTFGILIPIVVIVMEPAQSVSLLTITLAATLAGSVFGDHCSPISDTTILSSTGAGVNHMTHVSTQMVYSIATAIAAFVGYLVGGFTGGNVYLMLIVSVAVLLGIVFSANYIAKKQGA